MDTQIIVETNHENQQHIHFNSLCIYINIYIFRSIQLIEQLNFEFKKICL